MIHIYGDMIRFTFFFLLILLCGCEKYYLSVKREMINRNTLASTFVGSPDPRQKNPPRGQELMIEWRLPEEALSQKPVLVLKILYKNLQEEILNYPVTRKRGWVTHSVLGEAFEKTEGFLTYKGEIVGKDQKVIKEWKHQLWTNLIVID